MKLFIKAICIAFVLSVIFSMIPFQAQCKSISQEVFRLHILANSDSKEDQDLKIKVRDRVLRYTEALFQNAESKQQAENLISDNLQKINFAAQSVVKESGFDYKVSTQITNMYFSTRYYRNYTLPSGMYDALRITIGSGNGHNWWCVMYPSICVSSQPEGEQRAKQVFDESEYDIVTNEKYEYKFFVVELFQNLCNCFGGK